MNPLLTIVIPTYNSASFLENLLYCLKRLTYSDYKVLVCANFSNFREKRKIEKVITKDGKAELFFRQQTIARGRGKEEALNILIDKINTPYGAMIEVDAAFLKKDWDKILLERFDDKTKIAGAPRGAEGYPDDFPDSYLTLFDVKVFKNLNIDMRAKDISKGQDVGWEMYEKFPKAKYKAFALRAKNTRDYKKGPFHSLLGVGEYYLKGDKQIFASHFGRGSTFSGDRKYQTGTSFLYRTPLLGKLFRRIRGIREINKWTKICQEIINKQI